MPESAPRNELVLIDPGEWGRIFGPEQLVQIYESSLHQPDGSPGAAKGPVDVAPGASGLAPIVSSAAY